MLSAMYLRGLDANDWDTPGIFGARHARSPGSWRILCSYEDGKRHKAALFKKMAQYGQAEDNRTWDFHHVVEGQHFADIDFSGELPHLYLTELPCVLVSNEEHRAYNRLLHLKETSELFRERGLPRDLAIRSAAAAEAARSPGQRQRLRSRIEELRYMYRQAYEGDYVLITIAENVFAERMTALG